MPSTDILALASSGLNDFLFADVGTEPNGMRLSVLSVFARSGLDPWEEAARLNRLSHRGAIEALAARIGAMPHGQWPGAEAVAIATPLVRLLPQGAAAKDPVSRPLPVQPAGQDARAVRLPKGTVPPNFTWLTFVIILLGLFAGLGATAFYGSVAASMSTQAPAAGVTDKPHGSPSGPRPARQPPGGGPVSSGQ